MWKSTTAATESYCKSVQRDEVKEKMITYEYVVKRVLKELKKTTTLLRYKNRFYF